MIQAVVTDVVGILIGAECPEISPATIHALQWLTKEGVDVSLCTANSYSSISSIIEVAGLRAPQICDSGRTIIFPSRQRMSTMPLGSSKSEALQYLFDSEKNYPHNVLGLGDSGSDIDFMKKCSEVASVAGADRRVLDFVTQQQGYISQASLANAFQDIIRYYFSTYSI